MIYFFFAGHLPSEEMYRILKSLGVTRYSYALYGMDALLSSFHLMQLVIEFIMQLVIEFLPASHHLIESLHWQGQTLG